MGKNKQLTLALPVLLGVVIWVWLPNLNPAASKSHGKGNSKAAKDSSASHTEVASLIKDYSSTRSPVNTVAAWGERNPFDPGLLDKKIEKDTKDVIKIQAPTTKKNQKKVEIKKENVTEYHLSGIFWNEQKPSAIINDLVMNVGSMIGPSKVKEISANKVVLFDGTKEVVLMLQQN